MLNQRGQFAVEFLHRQWQIKLILSKRSRQPSSTRMIAHALNSLKSIVFRASKYNVRLRRCKRRSTVCCAPELLRSRCRWQPSSGRGMEASTPLHCRSTVTDPRLSIMLQRSSGECALICNFHICLGVPDPSCRHVRRRTVTSGVGLA